MSRLPTGTVTFLFTDIEGSTRLWETHPDAMRSALVRHDALLRGCIEDREGYVFKTVGDAFCAAFSTAHQALEAALAAQVALAAEAWKGKMPLLVRMALHTGATEERSGDYFGPPLNRVARLIGAGHGGQVLISSAARELVQDALPPNTSLLDLNLHRLKDLERPEQVFQLLHPALPADFPPLRSLNNADLPNNLPVQVTSFIGREKQIEDVKALMHKSRLVTLTGPGGAGKSRLSLQVAADLLDQYEDGAWLVELAPFSDPALVPQAVAGALGVREEPGKPLAQTLAEWLKAKHLVLVLDNCEHVLEDAAHLVDALLHFCPKVQVLASSREALGIRGESAYRVPSLSLPDPKQPQTSQSLSRCEAILLFTERAAAMKADFAVTDHNAPTLASVCHRLDGIPLAIELAAARIRSMTVEELEKRLADRFRLLTGGSRTALPRQQTLQALIDWSYDLLDESQKVLLARLSVFAGGWTLESAEKICGNAEVEAGGVQEWEVQEWEVLDLLTALVDKSLVIAEEQPDGTTRYRLLETVRQYARDRLMDHSGGEALRERHRDYFLAFVEQAQSNVARPQHATWLNRLDAEYDNLRAALDWCLDRREGADLAMRMAGALAVFWGMRGRASEGRRFLSAALALPGADAPTAVRAEALGRAGGLAQMQADYAGGRACYNESLAIRRALGDSREIAYVLGMRGWLARLEGDNAGAHTDHDEALALCRAVGDQAGEGWSLIVLGSVATNEGDYKTADRLFSQGIALWRAAGGKTGLAYALAHQGRLACQQGDFGAARACLAECGALCRESSDRLISTYVLEYAGNLAKVQDAPRRAARLYAAMEALREKIGVPIPSADRAAYSGNAAAVRADLGDPEFEAAWDAGQAMPWEQAMEYALSEGEPQG